MCYRDGIFEKAAELRDKIRELEKVNLKFKTFTKNMM